MDMISKDRIDGEHAVDWAARLLGGRRAMAERLTAYHAARGKPRPVGVAAIGNWKERGIPFEHCVPIEILTGGVVSRQHTRPTDFQDHWPELAASEQQGAAHA